MVSSSIGVEVFTISVSTMPVRCTVWKPGPKSVVSMPPSTLPRGVASCMRERQRRMWPSSSTSRLRAWSGCRARSGSAPDRRRSRSCRASGSSPSSAGSRAASSRARRSAAGRAARRPAACRCASWWIITSPFFSTSVQARILRADGDPLRVGDVAAAAVAVPEPGVEGAADAARPPPCRRSRGALPGAGSARRARPPRPRRRGTARDRARRSAAARTSPAASSCV